MSIQYISNSYLKTVDPIQYRDDGEMNWNKYIQKVKYRNAWTFILYHTRPTYHKILSLSLFPLFINFHPFKTEYNFLCIYESGFSHFFF